MLDELKQLETETQALIDELTAEMEKADEGAETIARIESEMLDSDAEFQSFVDEMTEEIEAFA